eukprot:jgi/Mesvir1/8903/Mv02785-RA.1
METGETKKGVPLDVSHPLKVECIPGKGRALVTTRRVFEGEVLLLEKPTILVAVSEKKQAASALAKAPLKEGAGDEFEDDLRFLVHAYALKAVESGEAAPHGKTATDAVSGGLSTQNGYRGFMELCVPTDNNDSPVSVHLSPESARMHAMLVEAVQGTVIGPFCIDPLETQGLLLRHRANTFGIMACAPQSDVRQKRAHAVYLRTSRLNHSCMPTVCRFDNFDAAAPCVDGGGAVGDAGNAVGDAGGDGDQGAPPALVPGGMFPHTAMEIRAMCDIEPGHEVHLSYIPLNTPYRERQQHLLEDYGFTYEGGDKGDDEDDDEEGKDGVKRDSKGKGIITKGKGGGKEQKEEEEEDAGDEDGSTCSSERLIHAVYITKYLCPRDGCGGTMCQKKGRYELVQAKGGSASTRDAGQPLEVVRVNGEGQEEPEAGAKGRPRKRPYLRYQPSDRMECSACGRERTREELLAQFEGSEGEWEDEEGGEEEGEGDDGESREDGS